MSIALFRLMCCVLPLHGVAPSFAADVDLITTVGEGEGQKGVMVVMADIDPADFAERAKAVPMLIVAVAPKAETAASDTAVYLGVTIRNYDRKYEAERTKMPHRLRVLDMKTGEIHADYPLTGDTVFGGIALADGMVFVTTEDGRLTAFTAR